MENLSYTNIQQIRKDITTSLHLDPAHPPLQLNRKQTAEVLGIKPNTLAIWACTGQSKLLYTKTCRYPRYLLSDVAEFIYSNRINHSGCIRGDS